MIRFNPESDVVQDIADTWNSRVKSLRIAGCVIGVLMAVLGVLCMVYPVQTVTVLEVIASAVIIAAGIAEIAAYLRFPILLRSAGALAGGILNIFIGILLLCSPKEMQVSTYAFMFALMMFTFGVDEIAFGGKMRFFYMPDYGWIIAGGILNVAASLAFVFAPLYSTIVLNYVVAAYLVIGGVSLFIETFRMKQMQVKLPRQNA
jgi:uncharacterized membrane protein HdeD (DUF308 family)